MLINNRLLKGEEVCQEGQNQFIKQKPKWKATKFIIQNVFPFNVQNCTENSSLFILFPRKTNKKGRKEKLLLAE